MDDKAEAEPKIAVNKYHQTDLDKKEERGGTGSIVLSLTHVINMVGPEVLTVPLQLPYSLTSISWFVSLSDSESLFQSG